MGQRHLQTHISSHSLLGPYESTMFLLLLLERILVQLPYIHMQKDSRNKEPHCTRNVGNHRFHDNFHCAHNALHRHVAHICRADRRNDVCRNVHRYVPL